MSSTSRKIGSNSKEFQQKGSAGWKKIRKQALLLHGLVVLPVLPFFAGLVKGSFWQIAGSLMAILLFFAAARLMRRGLHAEAQYDDRKIADRPLPFKLYSLVATVAGIAALGLFASPDGIFLTALYAVIGALGHLLAYGLDPVTHKHVDPKLAQRAGIDSRYVIDTLEEAEEKLRQIDSESFGLRHAGMREKLSSITKLGRNVLNQIEENPSDIRRARRFLVTYLDGTRNVVRQYRANESELQGSSIPVQFKEVLDTVEEVFTQQVEELKRDNTLDLEVQIEVLQTQLEREGAG